MFRRLLALVLALLPVFASAQGVRYLPGWRMGSRGVTTVLSAPMTTAGCYASPTTQGTATITVTRSTSQTINAGTTTCAVNELAVESSGASIWKASTNYAFPSEDIGSWNVSGTCAVTANQGPAGYTDLDLVTCTGIVDSRYIATTSLVAATQGPVTHCAYVAADSGTKSVSVGLDAPDGTLTVSCSRSDGGACTPGNSSVLYGFASATVGTTPVRLCVTVSTTGTAGTAWLPFVHDGVQLSTSNVGALFGRSQVEVGGYATPYIATAGASATRNATVSTYATTSGIGNKGCVAATAAPGGGRAWNSATVELLAQGTAGAANYWDLSIISGAAVFAYRDGTNTVETCTGGSGLTAGAHRIHACLNNSVISMWVDGATYACTTSGSAGLRTAEPSTVYIGQDSGGAYLDGNLSLVRICKGAVKPGDCK